ncbi:hypothetical protein HQ544_00775, partial [Candidatus Falkowbacteria bacterium]|nr:hypothetical protein [Candidatus Falkowbacteria bacterium]
NLFDVFSKEGGVFHLWGHSFEVEKYGMWKKLEKFFKYVKRSEDIECLTNLEVLEKKDEKV